MATSNSKNVIKHIKKRKTDLINVLGNKCCICGFDKYQEALEFHHVDPKTKKFHIASTTTKNLEEQLNEIKKCILVCSNCHRGIHYGYENVPSNWQNFYNEEIAQQLLQDNYNKRHHKDLICPRCGKIRSRQSEICAECKSFLERIVERPNREELKQLIRTTPFTQIGKIYGVSDNAIRKWCKIENLPTKKSEIIKISDKDWENI